MRVVTDDVLLSTMHITLFLSLPLSFSISHFSSPSSSLQFLSNDLQKNTFILFHLIHLIPSTLYPLQIPITVIMVQPSKRRRRAESMGEEDEEETIDEICKHADNLDKERWHGFCEIESEPVSTLISAVSNARSYISYLTNRLTSFTGIV